MNTILDCIVLAAIRRRLAMFRQRGDFADLFADRIVAALSAEMERRNAMMDGWDAEAKAAEASARQAAAIREFEKSLEPGDAGLRLQ